MLARFLHRLFWACALTSVAAVSGQNLAASEAVVAEPAVKTTLGWTEYPLDLSNDLKAIVRVKDEASIADADWFEIEINNAGPAVRIQRAVINAPAVYGGFSSGLLGSLAIGLSVPNVSRSGRSGRSARASPVSSGNELPAGKFITREPGLLAGAQLGIPASNLRVSIKLTLDLDLADGRRLTGTAPFAFTWTPPPAAQIPALQKELLDLMAKATAGPVRSFDPTSNKPSSRLSNGESSRLAVLLGNAEISQGVTLAQALEAAKLHQREGELPDAGLGALMEKLDKQWAKDPAVIAFYREALSSRSGEAVFDLRSLRNIWDDTFIAPIVKAIETTAPIAARGRVNYSSAPVAEWPSSILANGLGLLDQHYAAWAMDATIAPRLSKAILIANPALTGGGPNEQPGSQEFSNALSLLGLTHDRAMIAVLRPFLANKTVDGNGIISRKRTPYRVCEIAANALCQLIGEPQLFHDASYSSSGLFPPGPYPEWADWDQQIAALEKRLNALPKP